MFAPTKTYRRWHRKVNKNQRRFAIVSAIAASSSTALVLARGHRINQVPEIPLVVKDDTLVKTEKTKFAVKALQALHAYNDVEKVKHSKKLRAGKGKMRNRRYVQRRGPLIVFHQFGHFLRAFRNLPGVEMCNVNKLNLLQLAPGGHLGRFIIWTQSALGRLDALYGTYRRGSTLKVGYKLPRPVLTNADLGRLINSQEVQAHLRKKKGHKKHAVHKKNPLSNLGVMLKLNPYHKTVVRRAILHDRASKAKRSAWKKNRKDAKKVKKDAKKGKKPADAAAAAADASKAKPAAAAADAAKKDAKPKKAKGKPTYQRVTFIRKLHF